MKQVSQSEVTFDRLANQLLGLFHLRSLGGREERRFFFGGGGGPQKNEEKTRYWGGGWWQRSKNMGGGRQKFPRILNGIVK